MNFLVESCKYLHNCCSLSQNQAINVQAPFCMQNISDPHIYQKFSRFFTIVYKRTNHLIEKNHANAFDGMNVMSSVHSGEELWQLVNVFGVLKA